MIVVCSNLSASGQISTVLSVMCSSGLCSAKLSNLYSDLAHQLSPDFARLLDFT